jgi:hypothetical protein
MWEVEVVGGNTLTESNVHYGNTPQSLDQEAHLGYSYGDPAAPGDFDAPVSCVVPGVLWRDWRVCGMLIGPFTPGGPGSDFGDGSDRGCKKGLVSPEKAHNTSV